ncbi:DUF4097 family beta strand repeat-containing protein [Halocatena halophila]|uniref:DUF4097 family beta strand repeat-containing protein n=1 Tax=Halocatena halophila TaxID=2814576 RepID=UPI002ED275E3
MGDNAVLGINNPNGEVTIDGVDGSTATIDGTITGPTQQSIDEVSVNASKADGDITVRSSYPDGSPKRATVSLRVRYPSAATVGQVQTNHGAITLRDAGGSPRLRSNNGSITARRVDGTVTARTENGEILVRDPGAIGQLRTHNGSIETDVPAVTSDVTVQTTNGPIDASLSPSLDVGIKATTTHSPIKTHGLELANSSTATDVSGTIGTEKHQLKFVTTNGSISLHVLTA